MLNVPHAVASALGLALLAGGLAGCGQRGGLYLPTDPAAKGRATLPQTVLPGLSSKPTAGATPSADAANADSKSSSTATNDTANSNAASTSEGILQPAIPYGPSVIPSIATSPVEDSP